MTITVRGNNKGIYDQRVIFLGLVALMVSSYAGPALATAENFDSYAAATANKTNVLVDVFSYVSYIMGAVLVALGVSELRRISDGTGGGSISIRHPVTKLVFGGMFLALPGMTSILQGVMTGNGTWEFTPLNAFRFGSMNVNESAISGFIANGIFNIGVLIEVSTVVAYIIGVYFTVRGLQMLRAHIDNPGQTQIADALKRLGTGGALFSLPFITHVVRHTFGTERTGAGIANTGWSTGAPTAGGLDGMLLSFVSDIANPAYFAIEVFCFVAGVVMILFAMQRLVRSAQDGPRGPLGLGTITMFIVAGLLISFPQLLSALNVSITGGSSALTQVSFMSESGGELDQAAKNVFSGVLAFMAVIGFLSVVRGLFMLKTLAEGGQATLMQVTVHLVAGALCINLGALINAIQRTLGLSELVVTFS